MRADLFIILFYIASVSGDLDLVSITRNFSVELLYHAQQATNTDVMLSPYVIWSLLVSLTYETLGVTRKFSNLSPLTEQNRNEFVKQFTNLRTSLLVEKDVNITLLNFLFYEEDLHIYPDSIRRLETDFSFVTQRLDFKNPQKAKTDTFQTVRQCGIAQWSLIKYTEFVNTTMVMCNCFTFKANWIKPFSRFQDKYHMKAHFRSSNFESLHASVTELPYEGGKYCLLIIRPHKGYDIKQVYKNLRDVSLKDILDKLQSDTVEFGLREVEVELPKYEINLRVILNEPLFDMGHSDMFYENASNFEKFAADKIYIGEIAQRVSITFDYLGTTVYANTPSHGYGREIPLRVKIIKKPFIFFIMEKAMSAVLFGGSYSKEVEYTD